MDVKIVFAIVGIIVAMALSVSCRYFGDCIERPVCDTSGLEYASECDFNNARRDNPTLTLGPCNNYQ